MPQTGDGEDSWAPVDGSEQVILGDLSILADGGLVQVAAPEKLEKVASATPVPNPIPTNNDSGPRSRVRR